ncbi:unnamed protein product [Dovyalis caffra]|uniref:Uncharacterized protein n=1 Tax=Dovyalis caffra TaxID=77055 RepID=A0AAV1RVP6_9ROSI|nr:unnamed protein product [Dovyalis caffra]
MVILALPATVPQKQKPTKRKPFNQKSSSSNYDRRPRPRKENNKEEIHFNPQENEKLRTTVVYIHGSDPDATESSSDEGEQEETLTKKRVRGHFLQVVRIAAQNNGHASPSMITIQEKQELAKNNGHASPSMTNIQEKQEMAKNNGHASPSRINIEEKQELGKNDGHASPSTINIEEKQELAKNDGHASSSMINQEKQELAKNNGHASPLMINIQEKQELAKNNGHASPSMINQEKQEMAKNNGHASPSMINHEKQELGSKSPSLTEKDDQAIQENGRESNKVETDEEKKDGDSSRLFTSSPSVKAADLAVQKELVSECSPSCPSVGLCDVPGPIPDNLDSLMLDRSLVFNFFEGLPDI